MSSRGSTEYMIVKAASPRAFPSIPIACQGVEVRTEEGEEMTEREKTVRLVWVGGFCRDCP